jgi:hypothetical protein
VTVEWLERTLEVEVSKENGLPRVRVLDASRRREVEDASIEGTVTVGERTERIRIEKGVPQIPEAMRGSLLFVFTASDGNKNESAPVSQTILYPDPPRFVSASTRRGVGTPELPLHSAECNCLPLTIENKPKPLVIETVVEYAYPDDLDWELYLEQGEERIPLTFARKKDYLELPLEPLLRALRIGKNTIHLSVFDSNDSDKRLLVHMERIDPLVEPEPGMVAQLDPTGRAKLKIVVGKGQVESVTVGGEPATPEKSQGGHRYKYEGIVKPHGHTEFVVEIQAGGRLHRVPLRYHRLPVEGLGYDFSLGGDSLRLEFQKTSHEGKPFDGIWFSKADLSDGVTRAEAENWLSLLDNKLRRAGLIRGNQRARLPKPEELSSLLHEKLIDLPEDHREWLFGAVGSSHGLYAQMINGVLVPKTGKRVLAHRASCRVIIDYEVDSELAPRNSEFPVGRRLTP